MAYHDHDGVILFQLIPLTIMYLSLLAGRNWIEDDARSEGILRRNP